MKWILMLTFRICLGSACHDEQVIAQADPQWCMVSMMRWQNGDSDAQLITVEEGPDKGKSYPVVSVVCLPPQPDELTVSYPQERP